MSISEKITTVGALQSLAQQLKEKVPAKVSELTNDAGYQTAAQVESTVNARVSSTYRAGGSVAFAALPELTAANLGVVVNVTDAFTTTSNFVEGAGGKHPAGTNVAVVQVGEAYLYDVLAGFVDLSGFQEKEEGKGLSANDYTNEDKAKLAGLEVASDDEVSAMLDAVFGAGAEG